MPKYTVDPNNIEENEWCSVLDSDIHGRGLFAKKAIPEGTWILQYHGELIGKEESNARGIAQHEKSLETGDGSVYIFELNDDLDIDGNFDWNISRLANHSCAPNCEAQNYEDEIWLVALKDIPKAGELTFDYGYDILHYEDHPCRCGSDDCVGYIVRREQHPELEKKLKKKRAAKKKSAKKKSKKKNTAKKNSSKKKRNQKKALKKK